MAKFGLPICSHYFSAEHLISPVLHLLFISEQLEGNQKGTGIEDESIYLSKDVHVETMRSKYLKVYYGSLLFCASLWPS